MANLGERFDATTVKPSGTRTQIAPGVYRAHLVRNEVQEAASGNGSFLWLEGEILEECEFQGETIETRLNLWNKNDQAVTIARADLSAICHATGVMDVQDADELMFKPMLFVVKEKPAVMEPDGVTVKYGPQGELKGFRPLPADGRQVATGPRSAPAASAPANAVPGPGRAAPPATGGRPAAPPATGGPAANASAPWRTGRAA